MRSGANCGGFWTKNNEEWFHNRVDAIKTEKAQPRSTGSWSQSLRLQTEVPTFIGNLADITVRCFPHF